MADAKSTGDETTSTKSDSKSPGTINTKMVTTATYKNGGLSVRRVLSAADWKRLGVEGQSQVVWERANNWSVDITGVHPLMRKYLEDDPMFVVEDHDA